ncbi:hypothetical protein BH20ACT24_BH20ACT24_05230 [soil metagenome]
MAHSFERPEARRLLAAARVGRMATVDAGGTPHVLPFTFVLREETIYWAVDRKPKRSTRLRRLEHIARNPQVEVLVDRYEEDWTALWWVRVRGRARVVGDDEEAELGLRLLAEKYPQHRDAPPPGPVVAVEIEAWSSWAAGPKTGSHVRGPHDRRPR